MQRIMKFRLNNNKKYYYINISNGDRILFEADNCSIERTDNHQLYINSKNYSLINKLKINIPRENIVFSNVKPHSETSMVSNFIFNLRRRDSVIIEKLTFLEKEDAELFFNIDDL